MWLSLIGPHGTKAGGKITSSQTCGLVGRGGGEVNPIRRGVYWPIWQRNLCPQKPAAGIVPIWPGHKRAHYSWVVNQAPVQCLFGTARLYIMADREPIKSEA